MWWFRRRRPRPPPPVSPFRCRRARPAQPVRNLVPSPTLPAVHPPPPPCSDVAAPDPTPASASAISDRGTNARLLAIGLRLLQFRSGDEHTALRHRSAPPPAQVGGTNAHPVPRCRSLAPPGRLHGPLLYSPNQHFVLIQTMPIEGERSLRARMTS
jgi:hypothetical protein